MALIYVSFF